MSAAIRRARASYVPPHGTQVKIKQIRSHSARHRCINDLKTSGVPSAIGKVFSRIASQKVYDGYGRVSEAQASEALAGNKKVQDLWSSIYE